ncbi:hypothetical protein B9P99_04915 [Candidatus Marsarchaeota G1 archaeon OSP_B]|uniref:PurM-like C-terminal domain-containing protein n=1 Tax=Candidatus Marsarchaeota G1 archaeon OSP_B TaxID=1978153 RepID=A0A2R6AV65_9ARCH|nr:MAG: hypothetical protein B9P99_04915 [Candidatus Marsarchaeota G1 archaeon OSP_B]
MLGKLGFIHSCTDSSDSLAISIKNLIGSQLDAVIERLPTHPLLYTLDKKLVENLVLYGGEEYALVFTYDEKDDKRLKRALNKIGRDRIIIGRVKEGSGKILLKGKRRVSSKRAVGGSFKVKASLAQFSSVTLF